MREAANEVFRLEHQLYINLPAYVSGMLLEPWYPGKQTNVFKNCPK